MILKTDFPLFDDLPAYLKSMYHNGDYEEFINERIKFVNDEYAENLGMADEGYDMINHPPHYKSDSGLEAIDIIESFDLSYNLGNVVKYIVRAGKKGSALVDLKKAQWYLNRQVGIAESDVEPSKFAQSISNTNLTVGPEMTASDVEARFDGLTHIPGHGFHVDSAD